MVLNKIFNEDCLTGLKALPDNSVDCCVTSPPYYGLRDYGNDAQIGLEDNPDMFVKALTNVFSEVYRVLKPEGTLWLNLGDSYCGGGKKGDTEGEKQKTSKGATWGDNDKIATLKSKIAGIKQKDLIGIPWMVAFSLRAAGWYLRQDIIWNKPNPMPESVTDRCTKSHEYIFLMSKSSQYYYDYEAIKEPAVWSTEERQERANWDNKSAPDTLKNGIRPKKKGPQTFGGKKALENTILEGDPRFRNGSEQWGRTWEAETNTRNKRSVWQVTTKPFAAAHFATFPEKLIVDCIKAGCPENGIVLDPFMGAGTTALVARKLNRNYVGFELNPDYIKIANKRLYAELGMFL